MPCGWAASHSCRTGHTVSGTVSWVGNRGTAWGQRGNSWDFGGAKADRSGRRATGTESADVERRHRERWAGPGQPVLTRRVGEQRGGHGGERERAQPERGTPALEAQTGCITPGHGAGARAGAVELRRAEDRQDGNGETAPGLAGRARRARQNRTRHAWHVPRHSHTEGEAQPELQALHLCCAGDVLAQDRAVSGTGHDGTSHGRTVLGTAHTPAHTTAHTTAHSTAGSKWQHHEQPEPWSRTYPHGRTSPRSGTSPGHVP